MSTNAQILKKIGKDTYKGVYLHNDGDIEFAGVTLHKHYKDTDKINKLMANGYISILRPQIGVKHDFRTGGKNGKQTTFYIRDRGDPASENSSQIFKSKFEDLKYIDQWVYVWENGQWYVFSKEYDGKLSDALKPSWSVE